MRGTQKRHQEPDPPGRPERKSDAEQDVSRKTEPEDVGGDTVHGRRRGPATAATSRADPVGRAARSRPAHRPRSSSDSSGNSSPAATSPTAPTSAQLDPACPDQGQYRRTAAAAVDKYRPLLPPAHHEL